MWRETPPSNCGDMLTNQEPEEEKRHQQQQQSYICGQAEEPIRPPQRELLPTADSSLLLLYILHSVSSDALQPPHSPIQVM